MPILTASDGACNLPFLCTNSQDPQEVLSFSQIIKFGSRAAHEITPEKDYVYLLP